MSTTSYQVQYTPKEEFYNVTTHATGLVLSVIGLLTLLYFAVSYGTAMHVVCFTIYGISLISLYLASSLYHAIKNPATKKKLRVFDHTSIYFLIAGTYTPFMLINMRDNWGIPILVTVWALAILGIVIKFFFISAKKWVSASLYIGLGWLVVLMIKPMSEILPMSSLIWLLAGGLAYTGGVAFYVRKTMPYHHAIWHLFVLSASICHFIAVFIAAVPLHS